MNRLALARLLSPIRRAQKKTSPIRKLAIEPLECRLNPAPVAAIQGLASSNILLGDAASYGFTFANTSATDAGFAPFIEVAMDTSGPDGATGGALDGYSAPTVTAAGLTLTPAATIPLTTGQTTFTNPLTGESRPVPAGFGNKDTIYVYALPFGSFTPGQTTAATITANTSNLADVGTPLPIAVTGGFRDDEPSLNGPGIYGAEADASVTPDLYHFKKIYLGPENETATGPNFVERYRLEVDIAAGQTLNNLHINDDLPPSMQIVSKTAANMGAYLNGSTTNTFSAANLTGTAVTTAPDGTLSYNFGTVTGTASTADAAFEFDFYVPRDNPGGATQVLPQNGTTGTDSVTDQNTGSTTATWTPIDPRDPAQNVGKAAPDTGPQTLEEQSIAVQKTVDAIDPATGAVIPAGQTIRPGQTLLRYTVNFQVSDYYAFDDVFINDVLSDGQRLFVGTSGVVNAFPTMTVNNAYLTGATTGSRTNTGGAFAGSQVIAYQRRYTAGDPDSDPQGYGADGPATGAVSPGVFTNLAAAPDTNVNTGGTSLLQFNVSQELKARLGANAGRLVGGDIGNDGSGPFNHAEGSQLFGGTTGTIVFYALVSKDFSDAYPSGDKSVDQGDVLKNSVDDPTTPQRDGIIGTQLRPADINAATPTVIGTGSDDSGTSVAIPYGVQEKQIYAINGQTVPPAGPTDPPLSLQPGDRVTYRLTYTLPISSFENLRLIDFAPLPVLNVNAETFSFVRDPAAYTYQPGQVGVLDTGSSAYDDSYFSTFDSTMSGNRNPTVTTDATANSVTMNFGSQDDLQRRSTQISLLVTFVVGNQPFASDLFLTNQLRVAEGSTNAGATTVEDLRRFELVRPLITVQKGTAAANSTGFTVGSGSDQINFGGTNIALPNMGTNVAGNVINRAGTVLSGTNAVYNAAESTAIGGQNVTTANPVDSGDTVRYAVVVQNTDKGDAFDVHLTDTIQAQYDRTAFDPNANLRVIRGDGTVLTAGTDYTITYNSTTGKFDIDFTDNYTAGNVGGAAEDNRSGALSRGDSTSSGAITNGSNTIILLYDVTLLNTVTPNTTITNTATVTSYSNTEGGQDLTDPTVVPGATDPSDQATVVTRLPLVAKTLVGTSVNETGNNAANQATIGELVTFTLTLTVPEGFTPGSTIVDTLSAGLAFVDVTTVTASAGLSFANGGLPTTGATPANTAITNGGQIITFNLGDITNSNTNNATAETITITYRAVVLNVNGVPANNQAGATRNNTAQFSWTGNATTLQTVRAGQTTTNTGTRTGAATSVTLVEPTVTPTKDVANFTAGSAFGQTTRGDAGDEIDYRITLAASGSVAHEVTLDDPLPTTFFTGGFAIQSATSTGVVRFNTTARTATTSDFAIDPVTGHLTFVTGLDVDMEAGATVTVIVRGTDFTGSTGQLVTNTAKTTWTSLDGSDPNERTGADGALNSGVLNDYSLTDDAVIESPAVVRKTIVATSEPSTTPTTISPPGLTTGVNTAVGEIVRYRVYVSVGETPTGTPTANFQIRDFIPTGMSFLNDGTARYAFISSNGTNLSSSTLANVGIAGDETTLAGLASGAVAGTFGDADISTSTAAQTGEGAYADGQSVYFHFGDISNADRDNNVEYVVLEYNVLVDNVVGNQAGTALNNYATPLVNNAYVDVVNDANGDGLGNGEPTITVNPANPTNLPKATATVVEPNVQINKEVIATTGSVVTYRLTVTDPDIGNTTTAFNTRVLDILNATNFGLIGISSITLAGGATGSTNNTAGNTVDVSIDTLPVSGSVVIVYTANVLVTPTGTTSLNNTGTAATTSLPGPSGTGGAWTGSAATSSTVPGATASATGERDGSGGVNDYFVQDTERLGSLGDRVYYDANGNGVQDAGEAGLVGVPVTVRWAGVDGIFNNADDSVITVNTGANGIWTVTGLPLGAGQKYQVSVPTTFAGMGVTDATDDGVLTASNTSAITLTGVDAGTTNNRIQDFGYRGTAKLGDRVYLDANGDGKQATDGTEPNLPGVTVNLTWAGANGIFGDGDDITFPTTTSAAVAGTAANYGFQFLPAGNFQVSVATTGGTGGVPDNATLTDSVDDAVLSPAGTAGVTLAAGDNKTTLDFGYKGTAAIGDTVWYDANNNGVQDAGEPGIAGATVTLLWSGPDGSLATAGDNVTFTTTTDANGHYLFPGLPVNGATDPYRVAAAAPAAYPTQTFDADGTATANQSTLNLGATETNLLQDFGYRGTASLGDFVWLDANGNGKQDAGEVGIPGVGVQLFFDRDGDGLFTSPGESTPLLSTTTGANGKYAFNNLAAGKYQVVFGNSDGTTYTRTVQDSTAATDLTDSDADVTTGRTATYTLTNGAADTTVDAGLYVPLSIGDTVWFDANNNGAYDAATEPGISNVKVTVTWLGVDGVPSGDDKTFSTTTDANGKYLISNLPPGNYTVSVDPTTLPEGLVPTFDLDGTGTANTTALTAVSGVDRLDADFGYRGTGSLGDTVFLDVNNNGVYDSGEGIAGVTVTLTGDVNGDGTPDTFTTKTDTDGKYLFPNLRVTAAGLPYTVTVDKTTLPAGVTQSFDPDGTFDSASAKTLTAAAPTDLTRDFGYRGTGKVGDTVFLDANGNGKYDLGEGITGVTVTLTGDFDGDGQPDTVSTVTDADGQYFFSGLVTNNGKSGGIPYTVAVVAGTLPTGVSQTVDPDGTLDNSSPTTLTDAANTDLTRDFGYRGTAKVGDTVWYDADANGVKTANEPGVSGVTVNVIWFGQDDVEGTADDVTTTAITGADGFWQVTGLPPGNFRATVDPATLPNDLSVQTFDLNGVGTPNTTPFGLTLGQNRTDVDFGYRGTASLGDFVWVDLNGDGKQDANEPGIPNATVTLTWYGQDGKLGGGDDATLTTVTDANGKYQFANLPSGNFQAAVNPATIPANLAATYDLDGIGTTNVAVTSLTTGQNRTDVDFGYQGTASVGDFVWYDVNADGTPTFAEPGIGGVTITLLFGGADGDLTTTADNITFVTTTGADGKYLLSGLPVSVGAGNNYRATVSTVPTIYTAQTFDLDGTGTPNTAAFQLGLNQNRRDVDFGFRGTAQLGDFVFEDQNGNGVQDATDLGIANATVNLLDAAGNKLATTTTDMNGKYSFPGLAAGSYKVAFVAPAGYTITAKDQQANDAADSDADPASGVTTTYTLATGENNATVDAGLYIPVTLGDRVFYDVNKDGNQDPGEPGIANVAISVTWFGPDGVPGTGDDKSFSTTTGADGKWSIGNLPPGNYSATSTPTVASGFDTVTDNLDNGSVDPTNTAQFAATSGKDRSDIDFGYVGMAKLGDRVYHDINGDGVQQPNEPGIPNVTVQLTFFGSDGVLGGGDDAVLTTVTDANGNYLFTNLPAGNFQVDVLAATLPDNATSTDVFDNGGAPTPGSTAAVTLTPGQVRTDVDFGYRGTASIGDTVYYDVDGDGVQGTTNATGNEPGIAGATVTLTFGGNDGDLATTADNITYTTTTDANGHYLFPNLFGGDFARTGPNYRVVVTPPTGYQVQSGDPDGTLDNTSAVRLADGEANLLQDFGYRGPSTQGLGNFVWDDLNGNGKQDAGEPGVQGATVELLDANGVVLDVTTTDANGLYSFPNLADSATFGSYKVRVTAPGGYVVTTQDSLVADDTTDSDINGFGTTTGTTGLVQVPTGAINDSVDAGLYIPVSIGDTVYYDTNGDGTQAGTNEPGIPNATVTLTWFGPDGVPSADDKTFTTTTDASGKYLFATLPPGNFKVDVSNLPNGLTVATADLDGVGTPNTTKLTTTSGVDRLDADFGYKGTGSVGDLVYYDFNGSGAQDAGEPGIAGATVNVTWLGFDGLAGGGDDVTYTTMTDAKGLNGVGTLPLGNFVVSVDPTSIPVGFGPITDLDGVATPNTTNVALSAGNPNRTDADFGYRGPAPASLGDRVWVDFNGDGKQDADEPGVPGATIVVDYAGVDGIFGTVDDGRFVTTTGANGMYSFPNLQAGTFKVTVTAGLPAGTVATYDLDGTPDYTTQTTLTFGQNRTDVDFGVRGTSSVSGSVFRDDSNDGHRDPGEPGYAGVTITLTGTDVLGNAITRVTTTDANGDYTFGGLMPGTYTVTETTQPPQTADGLDSHGNVNGTPDGTTGNDIIQTITLGAGQASVANVFGELAGSVAGTVFVDLNRDGKLDPGETPLPGETIQLVDSTGKVIRTTTTGADGTYLIRGFPPGTYTVHEVQPNGYGSSSPNDLTVNVPPLGLTDLNFAEVTGSVAGYVYRDLSVDGIRGNAAGETGIGGTTVTLTGTDVRGNVITRTLTTATDGSYQFTGLLQGDYRVTETQPSGFYYDGLDTPGSLGGTEPTNDVLALGLTPGTIATDYNFGECPPADPFGFVYVDANRNGVKDPGEPGIAGVPITISGTAFAGTVLAHPLTAADVPGGLTVFTNSAGRWEFPLMPPGTYSIVEATQPAGYLDGYEHNDDPNDPAPTVGNDRFDNIVLMPAPIRGPFDFGEWTPDPTKNNFLGSTPDAGLPSGERANVPLSPSFSVTTGNPTVPAFVVTATGPGTSPEVRVFDYATGGERLRFMAYENAFTGGVRVATGDVNGDGVPDIVTGIGVGGGPRVRAFSGVDATPIYDNYVYEPTFTGGLFVALGDINGDGRADLITGTDSGGGPRVRAIDLQTGAVLADFFAFDPSQRGGVRVAVADVNGDGKADIIATAGAGVETQIKVFSGGDPNTVLRTITPYTAAFTGGVFVATGDVNGDGTPDIVSSADKGGGPHVQVFDGKTGAVLDSFFAYEPTFTGGVRVATQDVNGDGKADIVTVPGGTGAARVRIFSGADLSSLDDFYAADPAFVGGVYVG